MNDETIQIEPRDPGRGPLVRLRVTKGPHQGASWVFDGDERVMLGRQDPSQIKLPDEPALSRQHVELVIESATASLRDQGSSNGTWVNGVRLIQATLSDGDTFGVGDTEIVFEKIAHESLGRAPDDASVDKPSVPEASIEQTRVRLPELIERANSDSFGDPGRQGGARGVREAAIEDGLDETVDLENGSQSNTAPSGASLAYAESGSAGDAAPARGIGRPRKIGTYELIRDIGKGGMATVHLAKHQRTKELFAIKLIRTDVPISEKQTRLFVREASLITRLDHPRIVKAFEFGLEDATPFLVMEYIETLSLLDLLDGQSMAVRTKTAAWVISRVLQALHSAHEQGIVHRDIKPANILAYRKGRHLQVKLGDFGLAKSYEDAGLSAMTGERSMRGTLAYMAPEQLRNAKYSEPAVDLFACGSCLYRMITGTLPNAALKPAETRDFLLASTEISDQMKKLILKSMSHDPADRFDRAEAFVQALFPFHGRV